MFCTPLPVTLNGRTMFLEEHGVRAMGYDRMESQMGGRVRAQKVHKHDFVSLMQAARQPIFESM